MWQYTNETIINKNRGNLNAGMLFADKDARFDVFAGLKNSDVAEQLIIDGVMNVHIADICSIYHTAYEAAEKAEAEIEIPTVDADEILRLRVNLAEQGNSRSILQNAYLHKQIPFTYEVIATGKPADDAAALEAVIKADLLDSEMRNLFTVKANGAKLVFKAKDEYLRFCSEDGVVLAAGEEGGIYAGVVSLCPEHEVYKSEFKIAAKGEIKVVGCQGAGTVKRLIKDLRIPSSAKVDPFEIKDGGMPIPGGEYDQYLIEVVTKRRHIAGGVVGSINDSLTSFVLFIEKGALEDFKSLIDEVKGANENIVYEEAGHAEGDNIEVKDDVKELTDKTPKHVGNIG